MAEEEEETEKKGDGGARPWQSYHTVYTNAKAGMEGVDKEKVQRVVYEMSKGSKYFENEERKEAFIRQKIERMRARSMKLTAAELAHYQTVADKRILELEATRDLSRVWLHVDMDAFYAAVETLSDPSLKGRPMAVGGMSMISTANYEARRFGVRAAMPGFIARKLCPDLIFVPIDFEKYTYCSDLTRKVFQRYDPNFIAASLDEAYLDITEVCKERGVSCGEVAEELRNTVFEETGLTCSAGVAANRLLAKVCSDINKPNGQFVLPNDRLAVMTFISSLPIRKIGGIGKVTECILTDVLGISTCEEMLQKGGYLCSLFSRSSAVVLSFSSINNLEVLTDFFLSVGLGLGETDPPQMRLRKSISNERTFQATDNEALLYQKLDELAELLSSDMQKEGLHGRTLTLKLKTSSFEVRTRALTLQNYISSRDDIYKYASKLLKAELPISLRLIGLRVSQFKEDKVGAPSDPTQKTLLSFMSADASGNFIKGQSSLGSETSNTLFMNDLGDDISVETHEMIDGESENPLDRNDSSDPKKNCTLIEFAGKTEGMHGHIEGSTMDKIDAPIEKSDPKSNQLEKSYGRGLDSSIPHETEISSCLNQKDNDDYLLQGETSSGQEEQILWMNDYECSLCGIELPSSFVEERQEHADFHLAERLQKKESGMDSRTLIAGKRSPRTRTGSRNKHKKRRSSPSYGHLPIDVFFGKINQKP
ncbi:DNA polymerase kappa isoform X1 [Syzygium oleosum]|uniref:DNA polymerase kappa isoform X1 n=1 Tax=Syzygium oleosum TaxID=219896 RepID=UPI0024BA54E5|nr:DNA polymerase kappa isoform X1 [Syzygium oleosum]